MKPNKLLNKWIIYEGEFLEIRAFKHPYFALRGNDPGIIKMHKDKIKDFWSIEKGEIINGHAISGFQYYRDDKSIKRVYNRILMEVIGEPHMTVWTIPYFQEQYFKDKMQEVVNEI